MNFLRRFTPAVCIQAATVLTLLGPTASADNPHSDATIVATGQHPRDAGHRWTTDLQGVTSDKAANWYFTQTQRIWKIPMHRDLDQSFGSSMSRGLSAVEVRMGFDHMGDPDYYAGQIYVPMERRSTGRPAAVSLRGADLGFLGIVTLDQGPVAPWIAVNPVDRKLYSSCFSKAAELIRYTRVVSGTYLSLGPAEVVQLFDEHGAPLVVHGIQGGAFSPEGRMYLVTDYGIEGFDVTTGRRHLRFKIPHRARWMFGFNLGDELEGIEFLDLDNPGVSAPGIAGQLHVVMIDNNAIGADDLYFEHFRIANTPKLAGP